MPLASPLNASEAGALAELVFQHAGSRPITAELRARFDSRVPAIRLATIQVFPGSLARDPIHPSTFYLAADALGAERPRPLLLRIAPASSPASGLFPHAALVSRMLTNRRTEVVVNAVPFAPSDHQNIRTFAEQVDRAFLPRPHGARAAVAAGGSHPETSLPAAFDAFRAILKATGRNLAAVAQLSAGAGQAYHAALWAAIRAGWREGYSAAAGPFTVSGETPEEIATSMEAARQAIQEAAAYTAFAIDVSRQLEAPAAPATVASQFPEVFRIGDSAYRFTQDELGRLAARFGRRLELAEQLFDSIRDARRALGPGRPFDFEVALHGAATPTTAKELIFCLHGLKTRGRPARLVAPNLGLRDSPLEEVASRVCELAAVARHFGAALSIRSDNGINPDMVEAIGRANAGRLNYTLDLDAPGGAASIVWLAGHLRG